MAHSHLITDRDNHFVIDPISRTVTNTSGKIILSQYDHNSERFTFEIPRKLEDHDMSECDRIEIHYLNIGQNGRNADVYTVDDKQVMPDNPDVVIFSWLISDNATRFAGTLNFAIRFICSVGDEDVYRWHTLPHSNITVATSISNGEILVEEYSDTLLKWYNDLVGASNNGVARLDAKTEECLNAIETKTDEAIADIIGQTQSGIESVGIYASETAHRQIDDYVEEATSALDDYAESKKPVLDDYVESIKENFPLDAVSSKVDKLEMDTFWGETYMDDDPLALYAQDPYGGETHVAAVKSGKSNTVARRDQQGRLYGSDPVYTSDPDLGPPDKPYWPGGMLVNRRFFDAIIFGDSEVDGYAHNPDDYRNGTEASVVSLLNEVVSQFKLLGTSSYGLKFTSTGYETTYSCAGPDPDLYLAWSDTTEINIPYYHNGKPVDVISSYSFNQGTFDSLNNGSSIHIRDIHIPWSVTRIEDGAFSGLSIQKVSIPDSVTIIGTAFQYCRELSDIKLSKNLTGISNSAFSGCSSLTSITIPQKVERIEYAAFDECTSLREVKLLGKTSIDGNAFRGCTANLTIRFSDTPNDIATNAFSNANVTAIYVPWSEGEVTGAPWGAYDANIYYNQS